MVIKKLLAPKPKEENKKSPSNVSKQKPKEKKYSGSVMIPLMEKWSKLEPHNMVRTFHPIGQGGFYYERHKIGEKEFTIVYDCGSKTIKKKELEFEIKRTFPLNHKIDVLFISHFHTDHINGINYLKKYFDIKNVVLPYLGDEAKMLVKISNMVNDNYNDSRIIDIPVKYFGKNTSVFFVKERSPGDKREFDIERGRVIDIQENQSNLNYVSSGQVFIIKDTYYYYWFYIPFNYKQETKVEFVEELKKVGLDLSNIKTISQISEYKVKIEIAYRAVNCDLNKNSMILFSGNDFNENVISSYNFPIPDCYTKPIPLRVSCIYFGDIDLNGKGVVDDIKEMLARFITHVGTIQIPHHGSKHNFDVSVLFDNVKAAVISHGTVNTYGHPAKEDVIEKIKGKEIIPYCVTEISQTLLTQWMIKNEDNK